ncbi:MAG: DUF805 domain-containing protein [Caulobacterales bacterium]|nr:DUF805 domain-containing protein [Caulobacterales bacterium]
MNEVLNAYRGYAQFDGRAGRREFWSFFVFFVVVGAVLSIVDNIFFGGSSISSGPGWSVTDGFQPLTSIFGIVSLVPGVAVSIRRMHDIGKSGWWVLVGLIPLIGWIWLLILAAGQGDAEPNAHGEPA